MRKSLVILGAREHAKVIFATLGDALSSEWEVVGFLDDNPQLAGTKLLGKPVLGSISQLEELARSKKIAGALVGISCNHMPLRKRLFSEIQKLKLETPTVISPTAHVHSTSKIGKGTLVCSGAVVHMFATVGSNAVLYSNSTVEHECVLGDNVYLGPGVNFCAAVSVGKNTFIGTGANVVCPKVGEDVVVGAGAAVVEDLPDGAIAVGVPARVLRTRTPQEREESFILRPNQAVAS